MDPICLFCKSYRDDLDRFTVLLESVERFNRDRLPFVLSVPRRDLRLFQDRLGQGRLEYVADEALLESPLRSWITGPEGWLGQQIVKMGFWRLERAEVALMVDSDFVFLRPFGISDFLDPDGTPLFVVSHDGTQWEENPERLVGVLRGSRKLNTPTARELMDWAREPGPPSSSSPWRPWCRRSMDRPPGKAPIQPWEVRSLFGRQGPGLHMMPGPIISSEVQRTFHQAYLKPRRLKVSDLLSMAPWEYIWLGEWLIARQTHDLRPIPPLFLSFTTDEGVRQSKAMGITRDDIGRAFLGVVLAARHQNHFDY